MFANRFQDCIKVRPRQGKLARHSGKGTEDIGNRCVHGGEPRFILFTDSLYVSATQQSPLKITDCTHEIAKVVLRLLEGVEIAHLANYFFQNLMLTNIVDRLFASRFFEIFWVPANKFSAKCVIGVDVDVVGRLPNKPAQSISHILGAIFSKCQTQHVLR